MALPGFPPQVLKAHRYEVDRRVEMRKVFR